MSTAKFCTSILFFGVVLLHDFTRGTDAIPLPKLSSNFTIVRNSSQRVFQPNARQSRLLGKFSMVAGLGLPDLSESQSIAHRQDLAFESHQQPLITSYNFPPISWGPYFAAVYEPSFSLFFKNPLKYLASIFNPLMWLNADGNAASQTTTESPTTLALMYEQNNQDHVVIVAPEQENAILYENRKSASDKAEAKMELDKMNKRRKVQINISTAKPFIIAEAITNKKTDSYTDKTSTKSMLMESEDDEEELEERQTTATSTTSKPRPTRKTKKPKRHRTTSPQPSPYPTYYPPPSYSPWPYYPPPSVYYLPHPSYGVPQSTYSPAPVYTRPPYSSPSGGGYYHGHSQNVSHVEFTTQSSGFHPEPVQRFADVPFNTFDPAAFPRDSASLDFYSFPEQLPPKRRDFKEFLPDNANNLMRDFKPSYPYQITL